MRVLFLEIDTESSWSVASMGPAFLAGYLRANGHEAAFLRVPLAMDGAELERRIREAGPHLLGLSLTTRQWQRARQVVRGLREAFPDLPIVAGGLHPTYSAEEVLASPGFDYVVLGEGETALLDLVRALERGRVLPGSIPNVWVRGATRPALRKPFEPLDAMPFLARDLLDERPGCIHLSTQRGCPFPCTYCAARQYEDLYEGTGDYGRRRTPENVIAELEQIRASGPLHYVIFLDDTFTIHHPWVKRFLALYRDRFRLPFSVHARVETVNPDLIRLMADAGCRHVVYGVESGSERVRREVMQRPVTNERMVEVFRWSKDAGMLTTANYMLGLPGETAADLDMTLALHEKLEPDDFGYFVFYPYPGTALFKTCLEKGYLPKDYLERPANHRESILDLPDLSKEDITRAYERFTETRARTFLRKYGANLSPETVQELRKAALTG